ncbi:hypothetical protein FKW77_004913 [Venturia effusa]|uniref:Uncharacterized protein n=1 Tax=Venturia effusa TaxID=50376 RepID=A0A517LIN7_9PEZI|nr:hypothetical protein FKW77_004913 [Venturia effusa]
MKAFLCLAAFLSLKTATTSPLYLGDNGPVDKEVAGTAGTNQPLQAGGQASEKRIAAVDRSTQLESPEQRREVDDVALYNRMVLDAHAAVAKLADLEPDDAQLAKAFIPPMRKRQASKFTITTTTTVPPVANVQTVTATATVTADAVGAAAEAAQSGVEGDATKASASMKASKPSANAAASQTSSRGADASSPSNPSNQAAASMGANANASSNSNSTESASNSPSISPNGATAAASSGRTSFDNSKGVEVQAGAIQAAEASSATQTDLLPDEKGTESANNAAASQPPVPDAAHGGPLPQPTGPPNNGTGTDGTSGMPQRMESDSANAQDSSPTADPATGQSSPPETDTTPSQGSDNTPTASADALASPGANASSPSDSAATPEDEDEDEDEEDEEDEDEDEDGEDEQDEEEEEKKQELTKRSVDKKRDVLHHRVRKRIVHERLVRRSGTRLFFKAE